MAPRPFFAPAIMAACCREGEVRRCRLVIQNEMDQPQKRHPQIEIRKKSSQMYLFLLKPQNIIIQDHDQGQEKENESRIMKEESTGVGAEAKRTNFFLKQARRHESKDKSSKKHKSEEHNDKEHSSDKGRERLNSSENGEDRHKRKERKLSRGRSHSRSRSRERLERAKKLQEQREKEMVEKQKQQEMAAAAAATGGSVLNVAALLASGTQVTPQIAMAAQMAALQAKALAETGIAVPSYYNPAAVNPMKFAEQEKKRKMLWQGKKEGDKSQSAEIWEKLNFGNKDQNVKFRKLMGIKSEDEAGCSSVDEESYKTLKQQEEVFRNLDAQYEMARSQTHTQRGMGLGFTSSMRGMDAV
ncbi:Arginine/serine-rich coiled-coil protein 2 [Heterocephalus glaber]|uniref:Arginine/serine-rich coiled-coil protein 2 n=1 Tax=Heterocephalus glaber TaxID=10181 RepID=G5AWR1_HETGA|nr:Arginine/serine-rich coiled-coil protein 2 [Heterocephalus glaber]